MIGFDDTVQLGIFISSIKNDGVFMAGVPPLSHTPSITDLLALSPVLVATSKCDQNHLPHYLHVEG